MPTDLKNRAQAAKNLYGRQRKFDYKDLEDEHRVDQKH
jgi:hypothetical protein